MKRLFYESAETLVYDPVSGNRTQTRSALFSLGFRIIETVGTVEAFSEAIRKRPPDLALCEVQGAEVQICDLIQLLRQGLGGHNPFLVIMATTWEKTNALVQRVVNSGADDLLLRPFSTTILGSRIDAQVERRKDFVVTTDYVGPDRRRDMGRASNVDMLIPPNSLHMKAKERLTTEEAAQRLEGELRSARDQLNAQKLRRDVFQVSILWRLMNDEPQGGQRYEVDLNKLAAIIKGIEQRCRLFNQPAPLAPCEAVFAALEGLEVGPDRKDSLKRLGEAAMALHQSVSPDRPVDAHMAEVDATVAVIRARDQTRLAS